MAVSTFTFRTNSLLTSPFPTDFPQFKGPLGEDEYLEGQNFFALRKTAHINANVEPDALLKGLDFRKAIAKSSKPASKSCCSRGVISGLAASLVIKNPLPLLIGLSDCFPQVYAQQKVGNEFQVNTYTNSSQTDPSIASFGNDNFVVTWSSNFQDGSDRGIYGQLFDNKGVKIGNEFQVNTYTTKGQYNPSVATLSNGNFIVAWTSDDQDGSSFGIYGQLFYGNGTKFGNEFRVNTNTFGFQSRPSVASLSNGSSVVTWHSNGQDGSAYGIFGQLFDASALKIGNEFQVNTYTNDGQEFPLVASFLNNNFVVTWRSHYQDNSSYGVFGQLFSGNDTKIGNEFQINNYTFSDQSGPSVATFNDGNFIVAWYSYGQDSSNFGIFGQLFSGNDTKIGNEFQVNTYTLDEQAAPSVTIVGNENFVMAWQSKDQDGSGYGIYGQLFDGNASKLGSEFQINTFSTNDQRIPSVASFSNGYFVVTWESGSQDGSETGIYGQIFKDYINTTSTSSTTSSTTTLTSNFVPSSPTVTISSSPSSSISELISSSSNPQNRLLWLWLLLGITGGITCLGLTGYYLSKKRKAKASVSEQAELAVVGGPAADARNHRNDDYSKLNDIRSGSSASAYANRPGNASSDYANRPKKEKTGPEYANSPRKADRANQYANVSAESESGEIDVVAREF